MAAKGDAGRAGALASVLAIMVAAIMILAAVVKLGFIADLISKPTKIRLHEWPGADHPGRPVAEAVRGSRSRLMA